MSLDELEQELGDQVRNTLRREIPDWRPKLSSSHGSAALRWSTPNGRRSEDAATCRSNSTSHAPRLATLAVSCAGWLLGLPPRVSSLSAVSS